MYTYKSKYDIIMDDGIYKSCNGLVTMPYKLDKPFVLVEKNVTNTVDEKSELIKIAVELGLSESILKRNSIETIKKKIEEAK